jgi:hypothetical protein
VIGAGGARPRVALGLIAVAAFTSACGEDGEESGSNVPPERPPGADEARPALPDGGPSRRPAPRDEDSVRAAIEAALASGDPAQACERYVTEHFVRIAYGDREGCAQAQAAGAAARSASVENIEVSGDTADALAVPSGGPSDGEHLEVSLVREGGAWKLDAVRSDVPVAP